MTSDTLTAFPAVMRVVLKGKLSVFQYVHTHGKVKIHLNVTDEIIIK